MSANSIPSSPARPIIHRLRRGLIKLLLVVGGVFMGLVIAELFLRLTIPGSQIYLFAYTTKTERYKVQKSNYEGIVYGVPLVTNEQGFRDARKGPIPPKQPGEYRIIVLGDSFTLGAGVPYESIATVQLEARFRARAGTNTVRVINLGVGGYNLIEYALVLEEQGLALQPDLVLVNNYVPNDYQISGWINNREVACGRQAPPRETFLDSLYINRASGLALSRMCSRFTGLFFKSAVRPKGPPRPAFGVGSEGWAENTAALLRIAALAREHKIPLRVCLLPHPSAFAEQQSRHALVAAFCQQNGIRATDTLPDFIKSGRSPMSLRLNLVDSHPNAAYHAIVAHTMFEAVTGTGFPPAE